MSASAQSLADRTQTVAESTDDEQRVLSKDVVFEILKNQRRRYVLRHLKRESASVRLGDLAEQVAAWENDTEIAKLSSKQRKRVYVGLYQGHLPKMDDAGVVEFNQDRGIVELTERATELEEYMEEETEETLRWSKFYLGLGGVSAGVVTATWAQIPLFAALPAAIWSTVVVAAFIALAIVHSQYEDDPAAVRKLFSFSVRRDRPEQA